MEFEISKVQEKKMKTRQPDGKIKVITTYAVKLVSTELDDSEKPKPLHTMALQTHSDAFTPGDVYDLDLTMEQQRLVVEAMQEGAKKKKD